MTRSTTISIPFLCAALLCGPIPASAAGPASDAPEPAAGDGDVDDANYERAVEAYRRGTELYAAAKFEEALQAFQEAATLYASPDFQFNIAKCYERLGNYEEAIRHYETYLRTAEDLTDSAVIESSIADLKRRIEERDTATPDDEPNDEPEVDPGPSKPPGRTLVIAGAALLGVGAAVGLGGGLGFGIPVASANSTLGGVLDGGNPERLTFQEADDLAARAQTFQTLELVMIGVGGALAITGAALIGVGASKNKKAAVARVHVSPSWARTGAGLTISGSF